MMEKIKIAYLDWSYIFAGAERVLYTIIDNLDRCQFEPYLIFPFPRDYQKEYEKLDCHKVFLASKLTWWHGSDYWHHPLRGTDMLKRMLFGLKLARYLPKNGIKILHVNLLRPDCYWWLKPSHDAGIKIIGHFRSQAEEWIPGKKVQECCSLVLCVSKYSQSRFTSKGKFVESRALYDSIDIHSLFTPLTKDKAKEKLGFDSQVKLMASVGQLSPHKGHDHAIKAFAKISSKYPSLRLLIAGGGKENDLYNLKQLAKSEGVSDKVVFTGKQISNIQEVYRAADLILSLTKVGEAFGLVPFEACYMGTPFIAPCFGAVTEFVRNKDNGLLVDTNNILQIAEAIDWVFSHEEETSLMVGKLQNVIETRITPSVMISNLEKVYLEMNKSGL